MRTVKAHYGQQICIGHVEDNESLCVVFDASRFYAACGDGGEFHIRNQRSIDPDAYPIPNGQVSVEGYTVTWLVRAEDLTDGRGQVQLKYAVGDVVMMDEIYQTVCRKSLGTSATPPSPWDSYIDKVEQDASRAEEAASHYPYIDPDTETWWNWDVDEQEFEDTGISASGIQSVYDDTTENWNSKLDFIPPKGIIIIYSDYATIEGINIPNFKVGDGLAYLVDLPFVGDDMRNTLISHINDMVRHITAEERVSWNNKVTCFVEAISGDEYTLCFSND